MLDDSLKTWILQFVTAWEVEGLRSGLRSSQLKLGPNFYGVQIRSHTQPIKFQGCQGFTEGHALKNQCLDPV